MITSDLFFSNIKCSRHVDHNGIITPIMRSPKTEARVIVSTSVNSSKDLTYIITAHEKIK